MESRSAGWAVEHDGVGPRGADARRDRASAHGQGSLIAGGLTGDIGHSRTDFFFACWWTENDQHCAEAAKHIKDGDGPYRPDKTGLVGAELARNLIGPAFIAATAD